MMLSPRPRKKLWLILLWLCCAGIFFGSHFQGDVSTLHSGIILRLLRRGIASLGGNPELLTMLMVRKAAHFIEYTLLGILLWLSTYRDGRNWVFRPLFWGLLVPVLDESLQMRIPGRAGMVSDVLIDFAGVLTGLALCFLAQRLRGPKRQSF